MLIGICGAHRTGKTTLCKELEKQGYKFLQTNVSDVFTALGYTAKDLNRLGFREMQRVQDAIFNKLVDIVKSAVADPRNIYVMDRTPIDTLAYYRAWFSVDKLTEYKGTDLEEKIDISFKSYVLKCYWLAQHFDKIVLVQPGINIEFDNSKALCDSIYISNLNQYMLADLVGCEDALKLDRSLFCPIQRENTKLEDRVEVVKILVDDMLCTTQQTYTMN